MIIGDGVIRAELVAELHQIELGAMDARLWFSGHVKGRDRMSGVDIGLDGGEDCGVHATRLAGVGQEGKDGKMSDELAKASKRAIDAMFARATAMDRISAELPGTSPARATLQHAASEIRILAHDVGKAVRSED